MPLPKPPNTYFPLFYIKGTLTPALACGMPPIAWILGEYLGEWRKKAKDPVNSMAVNPAL